MLLDTSGLVCYFDAADPRHEETSDLIHAAPPLLTHNCILAEFVPLCHSRRLNRVRALGFISRLLDNSAIQTVWVAPSLHRTALAFLLARLDKSYSLCDAVSFILMRRQGVLEALTTDEHFDQEGFVRLLKP